MNNWNWVKQIDFERMKSLQHIESSMFFVWLDVLLQLQLTIINFFILFCFSCFQLTNVNKTDCDIDSDFTVGDVKISRVFAGFIQIWNKCRIHSALQSIKIIGANGCVINEALTDNNACDMLFEGLKRIDFIYFNLLAIGDDGSTNRCNIDKFLQIIIPLSPKQIELRDRLKLEITAEMRQSKESWEIEELEKQIENEIDCKYNPKFDENELTLCNINDDEFKTNCKYRWHSSIEMLTLRGCISASDYVEIIDTPLGDYCAEQLELQKLFNCNSNGNISINRIKSSLINLRGLEIRIISSDEKDGIFVLIASALLNNLTNQLRSLHIDNTIVAFVGWKFIQNMHYYNCYSYPDTKCDHDDHDDDGTCNCQTWFPTNVEELCLSFVQSRDKRVNRSNIFWHYVNKNTFPKLKRFKVTDIVNEILYEKVQDTQQIKILINNLNGLIENGLESLQFKLERLDLRDLGTESYTCFERYDNDNYNSKYNHKNRTFSYSVPIDLILRLIADSLGGLTKLSNVGDDDDAASNDDDDDDDSDTENDNINIIINIPNSKRSRCHDFILTLEFEVNANLVGVPKDIRDDLYDDINIKLYCNGLNDICAQLSTIIARLKTLFTSFTFGFKLTFNHVADRLDIYDMLMHEINTNAVFQSIAESCIFDHEVNNGDFGTVSLVTRFKSSNEFEGENNTLTPFCNMDPKYEFECNNCSRFPWTEFWS